MRKIEKEMIEAIKARKNYKNGNTEVIVSWDEKVVKVELHGQKIARIKDNVLELDDCGYQTKTTKSRLNVILSHFGLPTISAKKFQWYIGDDEWKGSITYTQQHLHMLNSFRR